MPTPNAQGLSAVSIPLLSAIVGGVLALLLLADYFRRRKLAEVSAVSEASKINNADQKAVKPPPPPLKKQHARSHHPHTTDKDHNKRHHPLDVNTLKGHVDAVTALCFSSDGRYLATTSLDGVVRIFTVDDPCSKSFKILRINLPAGAHPNGIAFSEGASSLVVAAQILSGSSLYMYGDVILKPAGDCNKQQAKVPAPEIKWEHHKIHGMRSVLTLVGVPATYGTGDGSVITASCSEGTDIKLWHGKNGKELATIDTNQLKNNMATISPNGRFLAAAAFTADVKVWEIIYSKDGSVKEVLKVMMLKGHKSAVTCLCFTPSSEQIITASKDGTIRLWNINGELYHLTGYENVLIREVRYHLDEDPKTLKLFKIPLKDANGRTSLYERMSISPDGKILAVTSGPILQWLCAETGEVLDTADKSHEDDISGIAWAPQTIPMGNTQAAVLASAGLDKKVKLWLAPGSHHS